LKCICLVALVDASYFKEHGGVDFVLDTIKSDLRRLEEGAIMNSKLHYGTLIAYTGDNVGLHFIGGFKCGFTANKFCRFCLADLDATHTLVREDPLLVRKVSEYEKQDIENARTIKARDELSFKHGINKGCTLNTLQSFHVLKGLPTDLMHDILEGSLQRTGKNLLKYYIEEAQIMTLDWLNAAIRDFDFGYCETGDIPSVIR